MSGSSVREGNSACHLASSQKTQCSHWETAAEAAQPSLKCYLYNEMQINNIPTINKHLRLGPRRQDWVQPLSGWTVKGILASVVRNTPYPETSGRRGGACHLTQWCHEDTHYWAIKMSIEMRSNFAIIKTWWSKELEPSWNKRDGHHKIILI